MNIIVCLKQVPGTTEVKVNTETNTLVRQGIKNIVNPFDTYALEEGVRLKERYGGKVTAITMGPSQAEEMLREAISTGADEAILLSDRAFAGADTLATGYTLASGINYLEGADIILMGKQAMDGTVTVPPCFSLSRSATSMAYISKGLMIDSTPSRMRVFVSGFIFTLVVSGTCLMATTECICLYLHSN